MVKSSGGKRWSNLQHCLFVGGQVPRYDALSQLLLLQVSSPRWRLAIIIPIRTCSEQFVWCASMSHVPFFFPVWSIEVCCIVPTCNVPEVLQFSDFNCISDFYFFVHFLHSFVTILGHDIFRMRLYTHKSNNFIFWIVVEFRVQPSTPRKYVEIT